MTVSTTTTLTTSTTTTISNTQTVVAPTPTVYDACSANNGKLIPRSLSLKSKLNLIIQQWSEPRTATPASTSLITLRTITYNSPRLTTATPPSAASTARPLPIASDMGSIPEALATFSPTRERAMARPRSMTIIRRTRAYRLELAILWGMVSVDSCRMGVYMEDSHGYLNDSKAGNGVRIAVGRMGYASLIIV